MLLRNSLRSLAKQMPYSFINILGLTIGVATVLMVLIWIAVETSYDKFHKDHERLYRINLILKTPNKDINSPVINAPAGPIGYFAMNRWLSNFAYKTTISLWVFIASGLFAVLIGLLTVSLAANRASRANPAEILRKN